MKVKRYKRAKRIISIYRHNFSLEPPYKVLLDGTFAMAALQNKINLREQMPKYLNAVSFFYSFFETIYCHCACLKSCLLLHCIIITLLFCCISVRTVYSIIYYFHYNIITKDIVYNLLYLGSWYTGNQLCA